MKEITNLRDITNYIEKITNITLKVKESKSRLKKKVEILHGDMYHAATKDEVLQLMEIFIEYLMCINDFDEIGCTKWIEYLDKYTVRIKGAVNF